MGTVQTRRSFLATLSLAGTAGLLVAPQALAAEGALETTTVRLVNDGSICIAPEYAAEDLLRAEGFTDIRYVAAPGYTQIDALARGKLDFCNFSRARTSRRLRPALRSPCLPAFISAASNSSPGRVSGALPN